MSIAWLSGTSRPGRHALSPEQARLLGGPSGAVVPVNFPWPEGDQPSWRPTPLPLASLRNAAQFLRARLSVGYRRSLTGRVQALLDRTPPPLLIVTASQGLELLRLAWPGLRPGTGAGLRVVALGPVAGQLPPGLLPLVVQSRTDLVSRLGWRGPVHLRTRGGHLGYAADPAVAAVLREVLAGLR